VAKNHTVDLVCFSFDDLDQQDRHLDPFRTLGVKVVTVPAPSFHFFRQISNIVMNPRPFSVSKYNDERMRAEIRELIRTNSYDMVHVDHLHMSHYLQDLSGLASLMDDHNVEYKILERCAHVENSFLKKRIYQSQALKMKQFESQSVRSSAAVTAVSQDDVNILKDISRKSNHIHILPNGVDTEFFNPQRISGEQQEGSVVFTGSMDWLPNEDSVLYFCQDILPLIWRKSPKVKFYVVGKNPSAQLIEKTKHDERIIVTGCVEDVRPFMMKAKIFVVPLRIGGGTRLKILEAMSMEKCVVSTSIGAEGIACTHNKDIVLADNPNDFAEAVIRLMLDDTARSVIGKNGRELVCRTYDWNIIGQSLNNIYEDIVNERSA
jgi:glycosyltransferase involved in cell wall biosynthesis